MLKIETPEMTIGELVGRIEGSTEPIRRSTHIGNQPSRELVIMAGLPQGVDVLMVDTIQGADRYTRPNLLIGTEVTRRLVSNTKAKGRVVGSLVADLEQPEAGTPLNDVHQAALEKLALNNRPVPMMRYFGDHPELLEATMIACKEEGDVTRQVVDDGKIKPIEHNDSMSIYGHNATQGALLPLNGMMTMEILISENQNSDNTLHLGGADMTRYVRDPQRINTVANILARSRALLGMVQREHVYRVLDARKLAVIPQQSQHELLETGEGVDISAHLNIVLGNHDN